MAITNNGLNLGGSALVLATAEGATIPSNTEFTDYEYVQDLVLSVAKAGVDEATEAATINAIVSSCETTMNAQVTNDFDAAQTITSFGKLNRITLNEDNKYNNTAEAYDCYIKLYVKQG